MIRTWSRQRLKQKLAVLKRRPWLSCSDTDFTFKAMQLADFSPSSNRDICNAQASEALAAAGLPAAVRKALDFEHELAKLTHGQGPRATAAQLMSHVCMCARVQAANSGCHGVSKTCSELQRAQRLASVGVFKNQDGDGFGWMGCDAKFRLHCLTFKVWPELLSRWTGCELRKLQALRA